MKSQECSSVSVNPVTVQRKEVPDSCIVNVPQASNPLHQRDSVAILVNKLWSNDVTSPQIIREVMELDCRELNYSCKICANEQVESIEDERFFQIITAEMHKNQLGNWEAPLPFKTDEFNLSGFLRRLLPLKRKLCKDDKARENYITLMQKILERQHSSRVPDKELTPTPGKVWYLPHFDVYHPKKHDQVHLFGAVSSPVIANYSLHKTAETRRAEFGNKPADFLCRNRYVNERWIGTTRFLKKIIARWERWRTELALLEKVKLNRCVKPPGFGSPVQAEVHSFSNARESGIGQVSYLRTVNSKGEVHVSFLIAKSRVAPIKPISIPRMELTAAVVSVNVTKMLQSELDYENLRSVYYTDSEVVIGYISNEARRFHVYVGNRVQHIRDRSDPEQWHHVPGKDNPADEASRSLTASQLLNKKRWLSGPDFLWESDVPLLNKKNTAQLSCDDVEVKTNTCLLTHSSAREYPGLLLSYVNRISS